MTRGQLALLAFVVAAASSTSAAQSLQPELRMDGIGPRPYALHLGAGAHVALGHYARIGVIGGYGARATRAGRAKAELRGDLIARLTLDPFRQQRWGLSLGGGITVRERAYLLALADVEGPERNGWLPALQIGAGGGLRAGVAVRKAVEGRR